VGLNRQEITRLIDKLRDSYAVYEKKHNRVWFNRDAFEERLNLALEKKMNLEGFILSEISHFEKLKARYDTRKKESTFSERIDAIMEEHTGRMKKYPPVYFHRDASLEMVHFYGAMKRFSTAHFPVLRIIVNASSHKNILNDMENRLTYLAVPHGTRHAKRVLDHVMVLSRPSSQRSELDIERDKSAYMRESAFLLHEIIAFCETLMGSRDPEWDYPLRFDRLHIEGEYRKNIIDNFSSSTGNGAIMKIQEESTAIIEDFRLGAFRGPGTTAF